MRRNPATPDWRLRRNGISNHPVEFLGEGFQGYFTCDGYQAYHSLPGTVTVTGCMAHARRRFEEALTVLKKDFTKEQLKEATAYEAMSRIGMLYKIEEMLRDKPPEERYIFKHGTDDYLLTFQLLMYAFSI